MEGRRVHRCTAAAGVVIAAADLRLLLLLGLFVLLLQD
jgi:hypothetical protein